MKYIVDRIENKIVICEDEMGNIIEINLSDISNNVSEGDVIGYNDGKYSVLKEDTDIRKKYIEDLTKSMWKN